MAFRIVDIVSNAGQFGAPFRGASTYPMGIEAGARHIKVFFDTSDVVLAQTVMLDTTVSFTAGVHYSFILPGFARSTALRALIVEDAALPTPAAGKFAIRVVNLAPSFAGAVPTLADTTVRPDAFIRRASALPSGTPDVANLGYLGSSQYVTVDTGAYRVALTATGTAGPVIVQTNVPPGVLGSVSGNPIAGSLVPGSIITALIVPRSVVGSRAPQGGRPTARATDTTTAEASRRVTRSNDTVTVQSGSLSVLTNRSGSAKDSTVATTGTGAATGVALFDNVLVTGATQPEYNGWQSVIQQADSLSCNPVNAGDTAKKCAAANVTATTRFRFRYRITGTPASPATGTPVYRLYVAVTGAADYTIPNIMYVIDRRPPDTVP